MIVRFSGGTSMSSAAKLPPPRLSLRHPARGLPAVPPHFRRRQPAVGGETDPATRRQAVAGLHELVGEDHRLAQAAAAEARVDDPRDLLLLERLVDERERQPDR